MREILFKAKRKNWRDLPKEEWWVEGNPIEIKGKMYISMKYIESEVITDFEMTQYILQKTFIEIDSETLCRYTGLTDKNDIRIWENDIISINTYDYNEPVEEYFGKVVYVDTWGCWCIQQPGEEKPIPLCECEGSYLTERVVEGNIFDNMEMMKGE